MESAKQAALKQFEIENDIVTEDALFEFNEDEYQKLLAERPWKKEYFLNVFSVVAHSHLLSALYILKKSRFPQSLSSRWLPMQSNRPFFAIFLI